MYSIRILQYNCDNLRWGWDYLEKVIKNIDIVLLQRFPKDKKSDLERELGGRSFMVESTPGVGELCVAIGKSNSAPIFSDTESITLPSVHHVIVADDPFQGCTALKTVVNGVNLISMLPCYQQYGDEYPILELERTGDIEHVLSQFKDTPTIIAGDFHKHPDCDTTNKIIEKYGFKSHLDEYNTWHMPDKDPSNLDKMISNFELDISDVIVYDEGIRTKNIQGHIAIGYTVSFDKIED